MKLSTRAIASERASSWQRLPRRSSARRRRWKDTVRTSFLLTSHIIALTRLHAMGSWQLQDAKSRFSEFLNAALKEGPQIATRRGVEAAILVPIEEWRRMQNASRLGIKELLLSGPRFKSIVAPRRKWKRRSAVEFE